MSLLVETIKIENGVVLNINYHNERMIRSLYAIYGLNSSADLERIIAVPGFARSGVYKCRVVYDNKSTQVEFLPYTIRPVRSLKLIVADNVCYPYKYVARDKFNILMERRGDCDDILIIKNGMVTDTSYANVIFRDNKGDWVTPLTSLLPGTRRSNLLKQKLITETSIASTDINKYSEVRLINAMIGIEDSAGIPVESIFF